MARWAWLLILLTAGCAQLPEKPCPVCPPPKPAPERAQYIETSFASVPGWDSTSLEPSLRAFMAGCPRASGAMINACAIGSTIAIGDEAGARRFFETTFTPFALVSTESGDTGLATGYAEQIGHPYRSLGRYLVERGELKLEEASMQGIKAWAATNPAKLQDALNVNASYVFFRESADPRGPVGALGVPLVPQYSLAVDRRFIPLGAPVFLSTTFPLSDQPLVRLAAAHDTGGAIRGAVRADFFWGTGPDAGISAGRMRQPGKMWLLWPR